MAGLLRRAGPDDGRLTARAGSVLVWARAGSVPGLYLAFAGIGLAGAAVLYQPAFATVNAYFDAQRQKALLTVTMVAGLASTIFLPASAFLISRLGWRQALLILRPARRERDLHSGVRRRCLLLARRGTAAARRRGSRPPPGPGSAQGSPVAARAERRLARPVRCPMEPIPAKIGTRAGSTLSPKRDIAMARRPRRVSGPQPSDRFAQPRPH